MKGLRILFISIALMLTLTLPIASRLQAAQITATPSGTLASGVASGVVITSPLIVSELHGQVEVQGTADVPNMLNYFLEIRGLNDAASTPPDDVPWIPVTLPMTGPIQSG